jgi:hypothetical protein
VKISQDKDKLKIRPSLNSRFLRILEVSAEKVLDKIENAKNKIMLSFVHILHDIIILNRKRSLINQIKMLLGF